MAAITGSPVLRNLFVQFQEQLKNKAGGRTRTHLKEFISEGISVGSIGADPSYTVNDVETLNGILGLCHQEGLRDVRFLAKVQKKSSAFSCGNSKDWHSFMTRYNRLGYIDPKLTIQGLAEIAGSEFADMSVKDYGGLLHVMDRQGVFLPELALHIAEKCWDHPECVSRATIFRSLAIVGVEAPSRFVDDIRTQSIEEWIDCAYAVVVSPLMMRKNPIVQNYVIGALENMSNNESTWNQYLKHNPQRSRDVQILRHALVYAYPECYGSTTETMKQSMAIASTLDCRPTNPRRSLPPAADFINSLSRSLLTLRVAHDKNSSIGPFSIDIVERDAKIVWQCHGSNRYFSGSGAWRRLRPYYALQEQILSSMGYRVATVPHWHWANMQNIKTRSDYCRTNRFLALTDPRQSFHGNSTYPYDNPATFDARRGASNMVDFHANQGEMFFKKSAPKRSWAWNRKHSEVTPLRVSI